MTAIAWSKAWELGVDAMDDTHPEFVGAINALHEAPDDALLERLDELITHTARHFSTENDWPSGRTGAAASPARSRRPLPPRDSRAPGQGRDCRVGRQSKARVDRGDRCLLGPAEHEGVCVVNFELHRRKTFWVDESLAYMLDHTDLDVAGRAAATSSPCVVRQRHGKPLGAGWHVHYFAGNNSTTGIVRCVRS